MSIGLILRLSLLLFFWDKPLTIVDEQQYQTLAENILNHHEFAFKTGQPTSIRPPLYPSFLSAIYFLTGGVHLNAVRIVQIILSLGIIYMVFILGKQMFDDKTGLLASLIFAVYPSFLFFTHFLLTEVLFTLLFIIFVYFFLSFFKFADIDNQQNTTSNIDSVNFFKSDSNGSVICSSPHVDPEESSPSHLRNISPSIFSNRPFKCILLAGFFLGLGALTRSILYPFLPMVIIFFFFAYRGVLAEKIKGIIILTVGFVIVVGPWTVRNFYLYKDFVPIGTMGGLNMYMGNYEHTPLNRMWAAVDLTGEKAWYHGIEKQLSQMNEAQKQRYVSSLAKEFILENKLLTIKRDLIKAANFFGLERSIIGPILNNHWPALRKVHYLIPITLAIFVSYAFVVTSSVFGLLFNVRHKAQGIIFILIIILYFTGVHSIVFGHSRYHLPLIPFLVFFSSWSIINYKEIWEKRIEWRQRVSMIVAFMFVVIWVREIVFVEGARYLSSF